MQSLDAGLVKQFLIGVTSPNVETTNCGNVVANEYVAVHEAVDGSTIQVFKVVMSVVIDEHVAPSHFPTRT